MHHNINTTPPDDMKKLVYYISQGRGKEIKDYYTKWHRRGLLGSTELGTDLTTVDSVDGKTVVSESIKKGKLSQNDIVYRHLINTIDFLENIVNSEGLRYTKQQLDNLRKTDFQVSDETLRAQTLIDLGGYTTLEDELLDLAKDIVQKNNEIQAKVDELTIPNDSTIAKKTTEESIANDQELKDLKKQLKELKDKRDSILNGDLNYKYTLQSLFISNKQLSKPFIDVSKDNYTRFKYGELYSNMSEEQQKIIDKEYQDYLDTEGKQKIILAANLCYSLATR